MKRILPLIFLFIVSLLSEAQQALPEDQPYGKIDTTDLGMKSCDFEKDANAEVLFDKGVIENNSLMRHVRIKIFNQQGVKEANVRILYYSYLTAITLTNFKGETINSENGKIVITPLGKSQIYNEKINRFITALSCAFPDVKAGSIIEYEYNIVDNLNWYFQSDIPTRYSEIKTSFVGTNVFKYIPHVSQPFVKNTGQSYEPIQDKAMVNIHSLPNEPYMDSRLDNLQHMQYLGYDRRADNWLTIADLLIDFDAFGGQFGRGLAGQDSIIMKARSMKTEDDKIASIFNSVKNRMKWNNITNFFTTDGTIRAWDNKVGNSAEINLCLYHLLKKSGVNAYPMVVSTKSNGKINPFDPNPFSFNNTVVYIPIDTTDANNLKYYVLDAASKFNMYNIIPKDQLNTFGFCVDPDKSYTKTTFIENREPAIQSVFIDAEIKPEGKMTGTAEINSSSYNKSENIRRYVTDGEAKFEDYLCDSDNNINITSLKVQNLAVDSLPFVQDLRFTYNLTGSDSSYIFFNPNFFITPHKNPFLGEDRYSDIDFGYKNNAALSGIFKTPEGYKIYSVPKNTVLIMPDTSIIFRRTVNQQDSTVTVRYTVIYKKTIYFKKDYPPFYQFFKKMYELLNEQIVLKKS